MEELMEWNAVERAIQTELNLVCPMMGMCISTRHLRTLNISVPDMRKMGSWLVKLFLHMVEITFYPNESLGRH